MHTLLDLHGNIPTFIRITDGETSDVNILDEFIPEAGSLLCNGPRVRRFRTPLRVHPLLYLLSWGAQKKMSCSSAVTLTRWTRQFAMIWQHWRDELRDEPPAIADDHDEDLGDNEKEKVDSTDPSDGYRLVIVVEKARRTPQLLAVKSRVAT